MQALAAIADQLKDVSDAEIAQQELKGFLRAVFNHTDVQMCRGCAQRDQVRTEYQKLEAREVDADLLLELMDYTETIQGNNHKLEQLEAQIDCAFHQAAA